jgi:hypothetical protein
VEIFMCLNVRFFEEPINIHSFLLWSCCFSILSRDPPMLQATDL